ncbi:4-hydroxy-tetrahydrodipicolinate reductase [Kordia sp. YSTF-M3]|uniref:4-hydroxy-tetrahydrodipicolinate reductase n=1 Tax=Kordia aestuariivivens TaxID=2759037 RepID=A0ABR7Q576_9FLAO|nr:4-hydroxy-tetrahydrodipicolinate reductase [Kordia aestuariivivens]MBC8753721.1 4-hydroxy-tetrahydrodipicolinate reductase [Kordia aestuariivivens]
MNIALLGYGRMGKEIEKVALQRGHTIVHKISSDIASYDFTNVDVAIDFSIPSAAFQNITHCIKQQVPVISGTTGWLEKYDEVIALCEAEKGAFIYASNFSLGVNIFFEMNTYLAKMMSQLEDYNVDIEEIHHTKKLDAPSGTAITLAEDIMQHTDYTNWKLDKTEAADEIPIVAKRIPDVPGTHEITYTSSIDTIAIKHEAHNRQGFALGAVVAAEWIQNSVGVYTMKDVLNI